uniref:Serpentine receptor class gamma n=1 Tax=Panagrellus redivivus TaxID=6233 RepID=A0A7E4V6M4_PANRE
MTCVCFCLVSNVIISVVLSLTNRFILTFHQEYRKYLENKYTFGGLFTFLVFFYITFSILFYASGTTSTEIRQKAQLERPGALDQFFSEASFVYLMDLNGTTRQVWEIFFFCFLAQAVLLLLSVTWFVYNVFLVGKKTKIISKTSKSLVISSVFQAFICVVFLFSPVLWVVGSGAFNVQNSANVSNALVTLISLHGTIDMLTTLYFVVPYRKFCKGLLSHKRVKTFTIKIRHPTV